MDCSRQLTKEKKDECNEHQPNNVFLVNDMAHKLKEAAETAKKELEGIKDISSTIEILNQKNGCIVINELAKKAKNIGEKDQKYLVVYKGSGGGSSNTLFEEEVGKLRYVYIRSAKNCRFFVKTKLLRIMFHKCEDCQVSLRAPIVGMAEFFDCKRSNINIRIKDGEIPVTRIEKCNQIQVFQSNDCLSYIVYLSVDIKGIIIDQKTGAREEEYDDLGKLFWDDDQSQIIVCLSRKKGFAASSLQYALTDINQHIIIGSPEIPQKPRKNSHDDKSCDDLFGTTPPDKNFDI